MLKRIMLRRFALGALLLAGLGMVLSVFVFAQEAEQIKPIPPSESQDTVPQETYVSEVILSAPWAKKNLIYGGEESPPGEFGLETFIFPQDSLKEELPDPPLPEGPTSFTVAPNGDIYITDPLNKRIQRFDADGNFVSVSPIPHFEGSKYVQAYQYEWSLICADRSNNIYLLWWEDYTEQTLCKYDQQGRLLATYPFFPEVRSRGAGNKLYCDRSDRLFFEYYRKLTDEVILSREEERLLKRPYALFHFQIGTVDQLFTPEEQKASLGRGGRENSDFSKIRERAWKELPGKFWGPEIWDYEYVDQKGDFYHYWPTKQGITITKWYKP
ncbi:MAG: hypothetical protein GTO24_25740 [candidate division Zixibacteria bacterium]|nr:hypothetical protein [candidate division Zixibacteria bacterium]